MRFRPTIRSTQNYAGWSCALGALLTLLVAGADAMGGLAALERGFYDWRALHFQRFTPPPTDRLVHLDIDDAALETIGRWPWPRSTLADIVDEIRLAGADVLALDIIFLDPQPVEVVQVDGEQVTIDHDANLAAAFQRFARVLVPVSFNELGQRGGRGPAYAAAVEALRSNLELDQNELSSRLTSSHPAPVSEDDFLAARREALSQRIRGELSRGATVPAGTVRRRLLPGLREGDQTSSLARQFDTQFRQAQSVLETRRFARPRPADCPPLLTGSDPQLLPLFARATRYTGFVDDKTSGDGTVRGVPLWVEHDGWLYPQLDLALACAVLGADAREATLAPDRVTVPLPDGRRMEIPVRIVRDDSVEGRRTRFGAHFDIPWFGWKTYLAWFDYPNYREQKQHVAVAKLWGLAGSRKTVAKNNAEVLNAFLLFANDFKLDAAKTFVAKPPSPADIRAWLAAAEPVVAEAEAELGPTDGVALAELEREEREAIVAYRAIRDAARQCRALITKADEIKGELSGKVVLVGSTATAALDARPTSLNPQTPGVLIHGAVFNALMTGQAWRYVPPWVTALITVALGLLVTATVTWLPPWKAVFGTLAVLLGYGALNTVALFDYGDRIVGLAGPVVVIGVVWGTLTLVRFVVERGERARITKKFRGYVDPQLVEYVIKHPEVSRFEGQVREMTVCFTDLVGFTTMTEQLREQAVPILGRYINRMVTIMRKHRGFLNRLMGDGIMFSYGAPLENPNHAVDAVNTVLEMQEEMATLNRELAEEGLPQLAVRGGVSTGKVVVGDSGGTEAVDYTCLGDTTNFGARLESANKFTGTRNLISARTAELLDGQFLLRPVALLQVAGKKLSVMTFEPLAKSSEATDEHRKLVAMTQEMIDHYQAGRFEHCIAAAEEMDAAFGPSKLTKLYRDTCDRYIIERAPDGFHGQIVLTEK